MWRWALPLLVLIHIVCLGALALGIHRHKVVVVEIPEPSETAVSEPPPSDGPEGAALAQARSLLDDYRLAEAETVLTRVLSENPKSALAHAYLARAAYRHGQMKDGTCAADAVAAAEREVAAAEALQPGLADATLVRAYLQLFAGNLARAKQLGLDAERVEPKALRTSLFLAVLAARMSDFNEAERRATAIVLGVRQGFLLDRAYDVLADVYAGRRDQAKTVGLKQIRARHPGKDSRGRPR